MWCWIFWSRPPASQLSPCPTSPIRPTVCLIWYFFFFHCVCFGVCVLSSNLMHTKSSLLAAKQKIMLAFPKRSSSRTLRFSCFAIIFSMQVQKALTLTLTRGDFSSKANKQLLQDFADKGFHLKSPRVRKFLQGKDTLVCLCSSRQPGGWLDGNWMDICQVVSAAYVGKKNVGQRACTCARATTGQRAAASNYDFLSSGAKRLQLHFREGRRVFFFSCHSLAEVVKYNLISPALWLVTGLSSYFFFFKRENNLPRSTPGSSSQPSQIVHFSRKQEHLPKGLGGKNPSGRFLCSGHEERYLTSHAAKHNWLQAARESCKLGNDGVGKAQANEEQSRSLFPFCLPLVPSPKGTTFYLFVMLKTDSSHWQHTTTPTWRADPLCLFCLCVSVQQNRTQFSKQIFFFFSALNESRRRRR